MGLLLLTAVISVLSGVLYWIHRKQYKFAEKWPTVEPVFPLVGNTLKVVGKNDVERFEIVKRAFEACDRITKAWAGPKLFLLTSHPDLIQQLLNSPDCLEKPFLYKFAGFGKGLFTAKYHFWKGLRKRLNGTFNQQVVNGFVPLFVKCAEKMVAGLDKYVDGATVNVHKYTEIVFLEMACSTTLGGDIFERPGKHEFAVGLDLAFKGASKRMISPYLYPDVVYRLTSYCTELKNARKVVVDFFLKLVSERRQYLSNNNNYDDSVGYFGEEKDETTSDQPRIFVDELLKVSRDGKTFSETEITDNMYAVITGAVDTSSLVTAHACLFLSFYPEVQDRLFKEVDEFYPADCACLDFSPATLKQLRYTEMFLNEVQRHWPVVPSIARQNIAAIEIDGVRVPPGQTFIIGINALHHRKDVWGPDAERFDPENFSEERIKQRHSYAFLPFSGGKRICIGYKYAQIAMKIVMIYLVRNFKFSSKIKPEDVRFKHDLTMKLAFDHLVQITKRNPTN
ncbi:cytochrome P450 4c21 isoform X2 [Culex quinquefasciatus]|uniref:cytochrome P450 4c21 isoform X2 n=1 Tax=Culex quinquefasciatus TaxID=7176 RepID=UPI0018E2F404|nr:cytochrome P450 4c21 isoform X2 [Culex quinquefasciatus]